MGRVEDIRLVKKALRLKYRTIREVMPLPEKQQFDLQIFDRLTNFCEYQKAKIILIFVSTQIEVDTIKIIEQAFKDGKKVAVPKCLDKNGRMAFFVIRSFDDLKRGHFDLLEPDEKTAPMLVDFSLSICILPGFAFDASGYRIGFGKGYYDRFLQKYSGIKIGICYNSCIADSLPHGRYDVSANFIVTPKYILTIKNKV
ncbi:MAG: 5-formyltetrahydrofolate cyclo-ligase [Oscillospiraceae bacterium]